jgi:hypothetical protein
MPYRLSFAGKMSSVSENALQSYPAEALNALREDERRLLQLVTELRYLIFVMSSNLAGHLQIYRGLGRHWTDSRKTAWEHEEEEGWRRSRELRSLSKYLDVDNGTQSPAGGMLLS